MKADIAVIIPVYNRAPVIHRALDSVRAQTLSPAQVIVVDDGSTDNLAELIAREYPEVEYIHQVNRGVSAARNAGIRASHSEWIALLDSDDEWLPQKLQQQFRALERAPGKHLCHTDEIWVRNGIRVNAMNKHRKYGGSIFHHCLPLCVISPSSVLLSKHLVDETGLFDEDLPACEDYDYWLRVCAFHEVLYLEDKLIIKYGGHADQLSRQHWGMDRFRVHALEKLLAGSSLTDADRAAATTMLCEKTRILLQGAEKHNNPELAQQCRKILSNHDSQKAKQKIEQKSHTE